ncbi:DNA-binding transcriptional regulator Fis [Woeseiaceae bacterium]|nr:DNA-binding transcriptional regulator Fis [Woeseiaceae bacterium]MDB2544776.1 DNA-binding transcriptional regulator Fis [Woeseiaceae bacterium]
MTKKKMSNEIKKSKSMDAKLLRVQTKNALKIYFESLNGHRPGDLYNLVLGQVEEPLFQAVMKYTNGNQSQAAEILGINRGTLRKKLKTYSIN